MLVILFSLSIVHERPTDEPIRVGSVDGLSNIIDIIIAIIVILIVTVVIVIVAIVIVLAILSHKTRASCC